MTTRPALRSSPTPTWSSIRSWAREEILEAVRCPEAGVHNMLAYLAEYGGVRGFLAEIGLSEAAIARLRARLR
jgi:hypothetical protein